MTSKVSAYWRLMRADKPIGIYLLLWPTLWALLIAANGEVPIPILLVFVAGVILMRSAGCVINDYADRHVDGAVARTAKRPLAIGEVTEKEAIFLFITLILLSFLLVLSLNWQTVLLSVGALLLASVYPFMKRYTHLPQLVLGAAFSWSIPMAFMAIMETIPWWAWLLYLANLLWTVAYDTEYAMVDRDDDLLIGVKSTAILFGSWDRLVIAILQVLTIMTLILLGFILGLSWPFYMGLAFASGLFAYQQWLIRKRQPPHCFQAFLNNHYAGMIVAVGLLAHYYQ